MSAVPTLTPEQRAALHRFAEANGTRWKSYLYRAWTTGTDDLQPDGCHLRQVRNTFGPRWLATFRLNDPT